MAVLGNHGRTLVASVNRSIISWCQTISSKIFLLTAGSSNMSSKSLINLLLDLLLYLVQTDIMWLDFSYSKDIDTGTLYFIFIKDKGGIARSSTSLQTCCHLLSESVSGALCEFARKDLCEETMSTMTSSEEIRSLNAKRA